MWHFSWLIHYKIKELNVAKDELKKVMNEEESKVCDLLSLDSIKERFGNFGNIKSTSYEIYLCPNNELVKSYINEVLLVEFCGRHSLSTAWCDKIEFEELFSKIRFNGKSVKDVTNKMRDVSNYLNSICAESHVGKLRAQGIIDSYWVHRESLQHTEHEISSLYSSLKELFIEKRYGVGRFDWDYYLLDKKGYKKIGLVKVLKEEDSGLGYTVEDVESGKKYYHIPFDRLDYDMRGFPTSSSEIK